MTYYIIHLAVYIVSVLLAMVGLSCFNYEPFIRKGKLREFYMFYLVASVALGYLFASFILNFGTWSSLL